MIYKIINKPKINIKYIKRIFKHKVYGPRFVKKTSFINKNRFSLVVFIKISSNNVFFCLHNRSIKKTIINISSENLKIKITKKRIKFNINLLLDLFFLKVKKNIYRKNIIIRVVSPKSLRSKVLDCLHKILKQRSVILIFKNPKGFNGCKSRKSRRKKQKGMLLYH